MLRELPSSWRVVNGAVSNRNEWENWENEGRFRKNLGVNDYGTVAVIYNMSHADVCESVADQTPAEKILSSAEPCQPADMLLYRL